MKSRFCPSPTGHIHLGNMRTALFNVLLAKKELGTFLLRIEDTDKARSSEVYTDSLMADLHWLSCEWDEGPRVGGDAGPYWQSQRQSIYDKFYAILIEKKQAYHCFCSEEQLAINRKIQRASGQAPRYPGTCRHLSESDVSEKFAAGEEATLRFHVPDTGEVVLNDLVRGSLRFACQDIGDFIIRRADGTASFMYCNAVDDALMGVTHVLRGEDHLTNSPRQQLILQALEFQGPHYAHISLLLGKDGAPLSKRNGSRSVREIREEGYLPIAVNNYMARLGHYYPEDKLYSLDELAQNFKMESLVKAPARYDEEQLNRWQKEAIMQSAPLALWHVAPDEVKSLIPEADRLAFIDAVQGNITLPHEMTQWANAIYAEHLELTHEAKVILQEAGMDFFEQGIEFLNQIGTDFSALADRVKQQCGVKGKQLFLPLRIALTGEFHGPEMQKILPLMGIERAKQRFQFAIHHI